MANDLVNSEEEPCDQCDGKGWDFFQENDGLIRLERCDQCEKYAGDDEAAAAVIPLLEQFAGRIRKDPEGDYSKARYDAEGNNQSFGPPPPSS